MRGKGQIGGFSGVHAWKFGIHEGIVNFRNRKRENYEKPGNIHKIDWIESINMLNSFIRIKIYEAALNIHPIDRKVIEKLAFRGIPDHPTLRSSYWKILLNYHRDDNPEQFYEQLRKMYFDFIQELILDPHAKYVYTL